MASIVLFDGVCNFCNSTINFIIRHDREKEFTFAPLQSEVGQSLRAEYKIDPLSDSIILIQDGKAFTHSSAVLRVARKLGGAWSFAYILIIVPRFIRDAAYRFIAANRYHWFGKRDLCMIPTPEVRERFL